MTRFVIDGCRCTGLSFENLLKISRREHLDQAALQQATSAGRLCKHCRPWLLRAMQTGVCRFEEDSSTVRNGAVLLQHFQPDGPKD